MKFVANDLLGGTTAACRPLAQANAKATKDTTTQTLVAAVSNPEERLLFTLAPSHKLFDVVQMDLSPASADVGSGCLLVRIYMQRPRDHGLRMDTRTIFDPGPNFWKISDVFNMQLWSTGRAKIVSLIPDLVQT